jgi:hypothetical protein
VSISLICLDANAVVLLVAHPTAQHVIQLWAQWIMDAGLHQRSIELAIKYALPATYDAHYLAVAEQFGAELWTADGKFYKKVASLAWVKQIEAEANA